MRNGTLWQGNGLPWLGLPLRSSGAHGQAGITLAPLATSAAYLGKHPVQRGAQIGPSRPCKKFGLVRLGRLLFWWVMLHDTTQHRAAQWE